MGPINRDQGWETQPLQVGIRSISQPMDGVWGRHKTCPYILVILVGATLVVAQQQFHSGEISYCVRPLRVKHQ